MMLLAFLVLASAQQSSFNPPVAPQPSTVLATVNGVPIRAKDVEPYLWAWRGYEVTEEFIVASIVNQAAIQRGVSVSNGEVENAVNAAYEKMKPSIPAGTDMKTFLLREGFTRDRIAMRERSDLLLAKMARKQFDPKEFVKVSTILIRPRSNLASDVAAAIGKAEAAYTELKAGKTWSQVILDATHDPQMQKTQGAVGWKKISIFPVSTQREMKSLKVGGFTVPVQTSYGIQIFRIDALGTKASSNELDELEGQYVQAEKQALLNQLKAQAKITRYPFGKN